MSKDHSAAPLACLLQRTARAYHDAPAVVGPNFVMTYGELERRVRVASRRLLAAGCEAGVRVAIWQAPGWQYIVVLLALLRVRAVACPVNTRVPHERVLDQLRSIRCRKVCLEEDFLAGQPGGIERLLSVDLLCDGEAGLEERVTLPAGQPATILFTSGSMGMPKAAQLSYGNQYYSAKGANENIHLQQGDRWLLSLPLYHVGGLAILFRCLLAGAAVVLPEREQPMEETVAAYGITHVSVVPTQLYRMMKGQGASLTRGLKAVLLGGSALPPSLIREAYGRGLPLHTSYGLTEMGSQVTATPPGAAIEELFTAGRALPHRQVKVADDGEILVKGDTLFQGYVDGDALEHPFDDEGWFHTRDLGFFDASGMLRVAGRKDRLFISGGENIQPEEIEQALCRLRGVIEAVVVPVPDEEFGQRPVAFVRTEGAVPALSDLPRQLDSVLPRFKIPMSFFAWPDAPAQEGMKADRARFQKIALQTRRLEQ